MQRTTELSRQLRAKILSELESGEGEVEFEERFFKLIFPDLQFFLNWLKSWDLEMSYYKFPSSKPKALPAVWYVVSKKREPVVVFDSEL